MTRHTRNNLKNNDTKLNLGHDTVPVRFAGAGKGAERSSLKMNEPTEFPRLSPVRAEIQLSAVLCSKKGVKDPHNRRVPWRA